MTCNLVKNHSKLFLDCCDIFKRGLPLMSQQIEHEFKNLITAAEYSRLQQSYPFAAPFTQTNLYFDTATQQLQHLGWGLRLRLFATDAEQTLKVPAGQQRRLQEITDRLPLAKARQQQFAIPSQVSAALATKHIQLSQLRLIGFAQTKRQQAKLPSGLLVLDQTAYADGLADYEVELEVQQTAAPLTTFQAMLTQHHIPERKVVNKVQRAKQHFSMDQSENQAKNLQRMLFD